MQELYATFCIKVGFGVIMSALLTYAATYLTRIIMALSHAIMTALIDESLSGYELARSFDTSLGLFWHASHQQIYKELKKLLEQEKLSAQTIPQEGKPDKIVYSLTAVGRNSLLDWVYKETRHQPDKDDLLVKLYNVTPENVGHLIHEVQQRRQLLVTQLHLYEKIRQHHYLEPDDLSPRRQGIYMVLRLGLIRNEQMVIWCDEAIERLENLKLP